MSLGLLPTAGGGEHRTHLERGKAVRPPGGGARGPVSAGLPGVSQRKHSETQFGGQGLRGELGFGALGWTAGVDVGLVSVHYPLL